MPLNPHTPLPAIYSKAVEKKWPSACLLQCNVEWQNVRCPGIENNLTKSLQLNVYIARQPIKMISRFSIREDFASQGAFANACRHFLLSHWGVGVYRNLVSRDQKCY